MKTQLTGFRKPIDVANALNAFHGRIQSIAMSGNNSSNLVVTVVYEDGENDLRFSHAEEVRDVNALAATFSGIRIISQIDWFKRGTVVIIGNNPELIMPKNEAVPQTEKPSVVVSARTERLLRKAKDGCDKQKAEASRLLREAEEENGRTE